MKKVFKIIGIVLLILVIFLAASPFIFRSSLEKMVKKSINENLNAQVAWDDLDLSLFRSFPDAALTLHNFSVINNAPFKGDTLASGKLLKLDMGIMQLFKNSEAIKVDALLLEEAFINIKIDSLGNANYDIAIAKDAPLADTTTTNNEFVFDLKKYEITNSRIHYLDEATQTFLQLSNVQHEGNGDFSLAVSQLETTTTALASLKIEDVEYLSNNSIQLDAVFKIDLENQKYTFLENEARINQLPLTFDGFVQVFEAYNEIDLRFKTPSSDFKNFLAVIPKEYVKELDGVATTGDFIVDGMIKGKVDDTYIPTLNIKIRSDNASFKYPDLPKKVENITIHADVINETGLLNDTYISIDALNFKIDDETFQAKGSLRNLTENMLVDLALKGTLNLANIEKVMPITLEQELTGVFTADVTTRFDMESVEKEQYQNIVTNGTASITNFTYKDAAFNQPIYVSTAAVRMASENITLTELKATSGETDISASGNIQNLVSFLMSKQDLKGKFAITSKRFNINDFMVAETPSSEGTKKTSEATSEKEAIKIPDFLDTTLTFSADKVIYDNLELDNAKGTMVIKDEKVELSNVTSSIFGGNIALAGNVSTFKDVPTFAMVLDLKSIDIDRSFAKMEMLQFLAPIAKSLQGQLNTKISLNGALNDDLTPILTSLAGDALAQIITAEIDPSKTPLLSKLDEQLSFLNLNDLSLRDVSTALVFNNGAIEVKPFDFTIKGITITAGGVHSLDNTINYTATMDVPAKYLGSSIGGLLAKLDPQEAAETTVALPIGIRGTMTNPKISINTEAAVTSLTQQLIAKQKQDLKTKGTDILKDIITGGNTPRDSTTTNNPTTTENTKAAIKDILGGILGGKKKKQDTTSGN